MTNRLKSGTVAVIIPARYDSTRFPGKPIALIQDKPMIQHIYERANMSRLANGIFVAVDDKRVFDVVKRFGGHAVMTSRNHCSGTDRIAEAVEKIGGYELIVNVQGDEPLITPEMIDDVIKLMEDDRVSMSSLAKKIVHPKEVLDPNVVKVIWDDDGFALYFSRSPIPFYRDEWSQGTTVNENTIFYKHIGIYGYKRNTLLKITTMKQNWLEKAESLEQLRALACGFKIKMKVTNQETIGIDVPEDIKKAEKWLSTYL